MLKTCSTFATAFDLRFNSSKTKCMYFSKNNKDKHDFMQELTVFCMTLNNVPCHVKAKLLSTYCLDLYGSQLWNYSSADVQSFDVA